MRLLGNIVWIIFGGFEIAILWFIIGLLLHITIVGIPFGLQCFKMAELSLTPFGKTVDANFGRHPIANIIWIVFFGLVLALVHLILGLLFFVTIIGIPFGLQWFKLSKLALIPFGALLK